MLHKAALRRKSTQRNCEINKSFKPICSVYGCCLAGGTEDARVFADDHRDHRAARGYIFRPCPVRMDRKFPLIGS